MYICSIFGSGDCGLQRTIVSSQLKTLPEFSDAMRVSVYYAVHLCTNDEYEADHSDRRISMLFCAIHLRIGVCCAGRRSVRTHARTHTLPQMAWHND